MDRVPDAVPHTEHGFRRAAPGDAPPAPSPNREAWRRRRTTIPAMLGATAAGLALSPVLLPAAAVYDLVGGRRRLPSVRVALFAGQYLVNDSAEILAAGPLWLAAGLGSTLDSPASRRRHERLQAWSIRTLARRADRLLGVHLKVREGAEGVLAPAPAIVVCRHVSLFDASLPSLLYDRLGFHTRGVIMAELLADPGFDLLYQRAGSAFVGRDNDPTAAAAAAGIARQLDERTVAVIFPEARLARPSLIAPALERLATRDPARAERLAELRHLLPPRPGGLSALLDAAPGADVVVVNHAGFERFPSFRDVARHAPLDLDVEVDVRRIARRVIPEAGADRTRWLDELWCEMDSWVEAAVTRTATATATAVVTAPAQPG